MINYFNFRFHPGNEISKIYTKISKEYENIKKHFKRKSFKL